MNWHIVVGFHKYEMNECGDIRLRSDRSRSLITPTYMGTVKLMTNDGQRKVLRNVDQLYAETFPKY